jgi:hypothetical protein
MILQLMIRFSVCLFLALHRAASFHEVSRLHMTHQSVGLFWLSDQLITETSDDTEHSRQTSMPPAGFKPTI